MNRSIRQSGIWSRCLISLALVTLCGASATAADYELSGPVPGTPLLNLGTFDLGKLGYQVQEYFLSGVATSYKAVGPLRENGRWGAAPNGRAPFKTRMVVVRPSDPSKFNGTVLVEWLNVSGGADGAPDWAMAHRELLRDGFAYVGVSVQKAGIEGGGRSLNLGKPLKVRDPARYGQLSHPGDAYAYDIFTLAGRAIRGDGKASPLGPLKPVRLLAAGESQSSLFLTTYVNAVDPLVKVYDGFLIHSRASFAPTLDGSFFGMLMGKGPAAVRIRSDVRVPVLTVITELDLTNYFPARQADTERIRTWEIPGAAHADIYMLKAANIDSGAESIQTLAVAFQPTTQAIGGDLRLPMNAAPQHHYVMNAAVAALDRWVRGTGSPAHSPLIAARAPAKDARAPADFLGLGAQPVIQRDSNGNAEGGIRTPWLDVPTETLSGLGNSGGPLARLVGTTIPFDHAKLEALYPGGKQEYLRKFQAALDRTIQAGFLLPADRQEILALAAATFPEN